MQMLIAALFIIAKCPNNGWIAQWDVFEQWNIIPVQEGFKCVQYGELLKIL